MNSTLFAVIGAVVAGVLGAVLGWVLRGVRSVPEEKLDAAQRRIETQRSRIAELDRMVASAHDEAAKANLEKEALAGRLASQRSPDEGNEEDPLNPEVETPSAAGEFDRPSGDDAEDEVPTPLDVLAPVVDDVPPASEADDLQAIRGIGPVNEEKLIDLGIRTYRQLASLTPDQVDALDEALGAFPGRIERDGWVAQAERLVGRE